MSDSSVTCPDCGMQIPATNPVGHCPYCLLKLGLAGGQDSAPSRLGPGTSEAFLRKGILPSFGDYILEAEIAQGGMGVVYRARQVSLDRQVAIKMLLAGQLASPEMVERFRIEAQSASRLRHPGIIPIYEIGEWDTQHFFSMELVDGASLAECVNDFALHGGVTAREAKHQQIAIARLMSQVARALDFAHKRGILHRDVKPSNILIDEHGNPRLTDFGLAKLIDRISTGSAVRSGAGTPGYAAPEQATDADDNLTVAADVYGLGATLYHLLTGRPPFSEPTPRATLKLAAEQPPVAPRTINPKVRRDIEAVVMRCLQITPARRYHSAEAVADDLERFVRDEPVVARPIGRVESLRSWCRRNPALSVSLLLLALAITVGIAIASWQWHDVQRANLQLTATIYDLKWNSINEMLKNGQSSTALATVASMIRQHPEDPKPVMFAMSMLEQRRFPLPAAPQIQHPGGAALAMARMSPDGKKIATASFDGTVIIWDAFASTELVPPLQHGGAVTWIEFSPDGRLLASCCQDKIIRLWVTETGKMLLPASQFSHAPVEARFSPDGHRLLVRTDRSVSLLNAATAEPIGKPIDLPGRTVQAKFLSDQVFFVAQSNGESSSITTWKVQPLALLSSLTVDALADADLNRKADRIVAVGKDGRCWTGDFPTGDHRQDIARDQIIQRVQFSADGNRVAALALGHWARVFAADSGLPLTSPFYHQYVLTGARFLDGQNKLLTWGSDSLAQVWDIDKNGADCEPMRHAHRVVYAEAPLIKGQQFFLTTQTHARGHDTTSGLVDAGTGAAQLWSTVSRQNPQDRIYARLYPGFDATRFSPDGRWVVYGTVEDARGNEEVRLIDSSNGSSICGPMVVHGAAWGLMFTPDGSRLISTTSVGQVIVWSLPQGRQITSPVNVAAGIQAAEMSTDGTMFATGSPDGSVRIWQTATGQTTWLMQHGANIHSLAFSPDGHLLASAGADRITRLWDTQTGKQVCQLIGHTNEVMTVLFTCDGKKVVTGSFDFTARVWSTSTGRTIAVLPHRGEVLDVACSADGRYVATASRDCTAIVWDIETGQAHFRTAPFQAAVRNVRFSPDSSRLLTLDFHGLQVWDVDSGHPLTTHMDHEMDGGTGFQASSLRFDLTADGQRVLVGADSPSVQLWNLPEVTGPAPAWFPDFLESIAGERFTSTADLPELVSSSALLGFEAKFSCSASTDGFVSWARRWLHAETKPAK